MRARRAAWTLALALGACGWTPADEQVLTKFFEQSRLYDTTRLARFATVVFDPRTDGVVERFTVVRRSADQPIEPQGKRRQVTLRADVRSPAGQVRRTDLTLTLEEREGSWVVVEFR